MSQLRLATFNVKDFFEPRRDDERAVVAAKVGNVASNLLAADADVVALQEIGSLALLERLAGECASLGYGPPVVGTEDRRGIRCVILSRLPVLWSQVHAPKYLDFPRYVETDPDPFAGRIPLRRGIVHVRVDAGGGLGELDVITAHFKSNLGVHLKGADGRDLPSFTARGRAEASVRSLVHRAAEALFVRGIVDDVFAQLPDHAVCVMGDLNDLPDSLPVKIVRGAGEPAPGSGAPHVLHACSDRVPLDQRFSCFHGAERTLIDHILVSERLARAVAKVTLHNESLRYHGPHVAEPPLTEDSDHALCVAEFRA